MSLCVSCFASLCDGLAERRITQTTEITMLVGSVPNGLNSFGGLCAGSCVIVDVTATYSDSRQDSKVEYMKLSRLGSSLQVRLQHLV